MAIKINTILRMLKYQLPAGLAILIALAMSATAGYASNIFSAIALIYLLAVVYTALARGMQHGLIASVIVLAFNAAALFVAVEAYSFDDRSIRRIVLLTIALPLIAFIVGRLRDRNELLLEHERQARRKVEESEARLSFMAESLPQKIFTLTPDGKPDYLNSQWFGFTGLTFKQLKKVDWTSLIHPDDVEENVSRWERSLRTGEPFVFEHRFRDRHDGYHWHITRANAMRDETGAIKMWVGSSTDIHDVKSALERERKLERKNARLTEQREQLVELNKVKDEFISLASHQLRTPATGVKQYIGMVLEGYSGEITKQQRAFLERAYQSNDRQIAIVNDLLKVARVDAGKVTLHKEKIDLIPLISNVLDEQTSKFTERRQHVLFEPKRQHLYVMADGGNIRMVLENIIDNASKYTHENKSITIEAGRSKGIVTVSIRDEGVGIDPADINKVFHKFSRVDNPLSVKVGGSGLGLYWAKKIVDLHGGSISITSKPGEGSTFEIALPD